LLYSTLLNQCAERLLILWVLAGTRSLSGTTCTGAGIDQALVVRAPSVSLALLALGATGTKADRLALSENIRQQRCDDDS